eukprot:TRINITY_DN4102_c0_g1_i1.p2 TRINITY_DN4102_c0_g1~~TRINITY_DN4102_c0_g1_i1.p2  ORF type:complete len:1240 (+),score=507.15 TRINITY_DN4102_c0_g1_i1:4158-7877(+)
MNIPGNGGPSSLLMEIFHQQENANDPNFKPRSRSKTRSTLSLEMAPRRRANSILTPMAIQQPEEFTVQFKSIEDAESSTTFLGPDGFFYNHFYQKIVFGPQLTPDPPCFPSNSPSSPSQEQLSAKVGEELDSVRLLCGLDRFTLKKMPLPSSFSSFNEYENALIDWKCKVFGKMNQLKLPLPTSRHFFRPRVTQEKEIEMNLVSNGEGSGLIGGKEPNKRDISDAEEMLERLRPDQLTSDQLAQLLHGRKTNPLKTDAEFAKLKMKEDPWDSKLLPQEPNPNNYPTFEDYEIAMKNWTRICESFSRSIPMKASQLKDVIPISMPKEDLQVEVVSETRRDISRESEVKDSLNPRMIHIPFFERIPQLEERKREYSGSRAKLRLKLNEKEKAIELIGRIMEDFNRKPSIAAQLIQIPKEREANKLPQLSKELGIGNELSNIKPKPPLLPIIHGIFKPEVLSGNPLMCSTSTYSSSLFGSNSSPSGSPSNSTSSSPSKKNVSNNNQKQRKALRRTDLTGPVLMGCMDCPSIINGKAVSMYLPDFDLEYSLFDLQDNLLKDQLKDRLFRLNYSQWKDKFNYFFHPKTSSASLKDSLDKFKEIFEESFNSNSKEAKLAKFTEDQMQRLVTLHMFLDQFEGALSMDFPQASSTYLEYIIKSMDKSLFKSLLKSLENHESMEINSKISTICYKIIRINLNGKELVDSIIEDARLLSLLAKALSFFSSERIDIYPLQLESLQLFNMKFKEDYSMIIDSIFCNYYMNVICNILSRAFNNVPLFLLDNKKVCTNKIITNLREKKNFTSIIWKGIVHSSKQLSGYSLFLLLQIGSNRAKSLQDLLRSDETKLFDEFHSLFDESSSLRFSHVKFNIERIFAMFQGDLWRDWLFSKHTHDSLLHDLKHDKRENGLWNPSHLSQLTLQIFVETLNKPATSKENLMFLLDGSFFSEAINHLVRTCAHFDDRSSIFCELIESIASCYPKFVAQKGTKDSKFKKISANDVLKMVSIISDSQRDDGNAIKLYAQRTKILLALKQLVKNSEIFESLKKASEFWTSLYSFCKDPVDITFNRAAWSLFYNSVHRYKGVLNHLKKTGVLNSFLGLLAPNQKPVVIMHSTHYLQKLFNMAVIDGRRVEANKPALREASKTLEKDYKIMNEFYSENFVKIHMIYKQVNVRGRLFIEIANLYHTFATIKQCDSLRKSIYKNPEYKNGIMAMENLFGSEADHNLAKIRSPITKSPSMFDKMLGNK